MKAILQQIRKKSSDSAFEAVISVNGKLQSFAFSPEPVDLGAVSAVGSLKFYRFFGLNRIAALEVENRVTFLMRGQTVELPYDLGELLTEKEIIERFHHRAARVTVQE